jgi:hypothetical protein
LRNRDVRCFPKGVGVAYGCSSHAADAAFFATYDDIEAITFVGWQCAAALFQPVFHPDDGPEYANDPAEISWAFAAGIYAINAAMKIDAAL